MNPKLRSQAIKTAAALPAGDPRRKDILAVLEKTASPALGVGKTIETAHLRIHRYADSVRIWDLTNAGRRGRKVDTMAITDIDYLNGNDLAIVKFDRWLGKAVGGQEFSDVKRGFETLAKDLDRSGQHPLPRMHLNQERGVDVDPPESIARKVRFTIIDRPDRVLSVEAKPSDVSIRETTHQLNDRGERQFYLHDSVVSNTSKKRETRALYNWVVENSVKLKQMGNLADVKKLLNREGVPYRTFNLD